MNEMVTNRQSRPLAMRALSWLALALLLLSAGYALFCNLGVCRIVDYDEARHGINAYEMIRNEDYLVHTYQGETDLWNLKPPLSFWSIALSYRLFGYTPFALRFFSALSTLVAMAMLTLWAWRRMGVIPALMALMVFAFNQGLYGNHFSRFGDADALYQLFFTLAMLCMLQSGRKIKWYYGTALCFALAFLTKATHAINIPVICLLYFLLNRQWRQLNWKDAVGIVLCALVPIAVWAGARYARDGMTFFSAMLQTDVVARVEESASASETDMNVWWYYLSTIISRPALAVGLCLSALCAVYCAVRQVTLSKETKQAALGCLLWLFAPIVVYSLTGTRFKWYVYSGFMAVPALTAVMVHGALREGKQRLAALAVIGVCAIVLAVIGGGLIADAQHTTFEHTYQEALRENLDRDNDSGVHMYIQYNEEKDGEKLTTWQPGDMLEALLDGDVVCMDGGAEAFEEDEEYALLLIGRQENLAEVDMLMGMYMTRSEEGSVYLFEK
ncbi:MAG: glycosyltransferase family 39 protein [Eubacteriales bacterium]|nr:glycosyltransferase family 39 protein [Eubacteriales bacterium]